MGVYQYLYQVIDEPLCCFHFGAIMRKSCCKPLCAGRHLPVGFFFNFYNVVLVSTIQQCKSAIITLTSPASPHPSRSSQITRWGCLCYTASSHQPSILPLIEYMLMLLSPSVPLSPSVLCICVFPADRFIDIIFLDSIHMHQYIIFVFLFLTYFTLYNRPSVPAPHWNSGSFILRLSNTLVYMHRSFFTTHLSVSI